jgi:hypothetical protein
MFKLCTHQKNTTRTPIAVPVSSAADRTSAKGYVGISNPVLGALRTVIFRPETEVSSTDDELEDEADNEPRHIIYG